MQSVSTFLDITKAADFQWNNGSSLGKVQLC